jgi:hypothetical protein
VRLELREVEGGWAGFVAGRQVSEPVELGDAEEAFIFFRPADGPEERIVVWRRGEAVDAPKAARRK